MLVLNRAVGEKIVIGKDITLTVLSIDKGRGRLGLVAPLEISIMRRELCENPKSEADKEQ